SVEFFHPELWGATDDPLLFGEERAIALLEREGIRIVAAGTEVLSALRVLRTVHATDWVADIFGMNPTGDRFVIAEVKTAAFKDEGDLQHALEQLAVSSEYASHFISRIPSFDFYLFFGGRDKAVVGKYEVRNNLFFDRISHRM